MIRGQEEYLRVYGAARRYARHPHVCRIAAVNALIQLICWTFLRSLLPYAAAHAVSGGSAQSDADPASGDDLGGGGGGAAEASVLQGYAVEASLAAAFLGAVLSAQLPNKALLLAPTLLAFLAPLALLTAMSAGWRPFDDAVAVIGTYPRAHAHVLARVRVHALQGTRAPETVVPLHLPMPRVPCRPRLRAHARHRPCKHGVRRPR